MRQQRSMKHRADIRYIIGLLLAFAAASIAASADTAPSKKPAPSVVAFKPAINATVDVLTPAGTPREYSTASGSTLWSPGSSQFIYKGDKIKLSVFVSTGAFELQHVKVRLDNNLIATIDHQPWDTSIDTDTLQTGYHMFNIWAQSDSPAPYSSSEETIAFYLAEQNQAAGSTSPAGPATAPDSAPPATAIGASSQTIQTSAPLYVLPKLIRDKEQETKAIVGLQAGSSPVVTGDGQTPVSVSGPTDIKVVVPGGSTARRFVYALYREGAIVYESDQLLPAAGTVIRLQERTSSQPGLLPGDVILKAWGVDQDGRYGAPTTLPVNVPSSGTQETVK